MKTSLSFPARAAACLAAYAILSCPAALAAKWEDIPPEAFAQTAPRVDPDAGVEILFAEAKARQDYINYQLRGSERVYIRLKVFNEAGVGMVTPYKIEIADGARVASVEARTVKPDGAVHELDRKDIYDTVIEESSEGKLKAKGFAFPNVEPGDILELQMEMKTRDKWTVGQPMRFPFPAQRVTVELKPAEFDTIGARVIAFQYPVERVGEKSKGGYYFFELRDQPAENDEAYSIPAMHTEPFVAMYYIVRDVPPPDKYWKEFAKDLSDDAKKSFKTPRAVKDKAAALVAGGGTEEEKLRRIYDYCAGEIHNRLYHFGRYTDAEQDELKSAGNPGDTIERGYGETWEIRNLFGALARAAGFDVALVAVPDKRDILFSQNYTLPFAMEDRLVAVRLAGEWRYFDPGNPLLPFGVVAWWNADSPSLMESRKGADFQITPGLGAADSRIARRAQGRLSGRVSIEYTGYEALRMRLDLEDASDKRRLERISGDVEERLPTAQVSDIQFQNLFEREKPLVVTFQLEAPEYAQVAGKRLFVQPAVFQKGVKALFQEESRATDFLFSYPWTAQDDIVIHPPEGFVMETGDAPRRFEVDKVISYQPQLGVSKKDGRLIYSRSFAMQHNFLNARAHEILKAFYAAVSTEDGRAVTYSKPEAEAASL